MYKKGLLSEINLKSEEDEFKRYKNPKKEMAAAKKGKTKTLKSLKGVSETDAADIEHGWRGLRKAAELQKKYKEDAKGQEGTPLSAKEGVKARRRVYNQIKSGKAEPSIIRRKGKKLELVAGNSRAMFSAALGKKLKAHIYDAPVNENLNTSEMKIYVQKGRLDEVGLRKLMRRGEFNDDGTPRTPQAKHRMDRHRDRHPAQPNSWGMAELGRDYRIAKHEKKRGVKTKGVRALPPARTKENARIRRHIVDKDSYERLVASTSGKATGFGAWHKKVKPEDSPPKAPFADIKALKAKVKGSAK